MNNNKMISRILKLEAEMTISVLRGVKPHNQDKFEESRVECNVLRKILSNNIKE